MKIRDIVDKKEHIRTMVDTVPVSEALETLFQEKLGAIVVVDEHEHLAGLISERDLVRAMSIYGNDSPEILVRDIMAVDVVVCTPDNTLHEALTLMSENNVRHLPVLSKDGVLVGFVGVVEVMRYFLKEVGCAVNIPVDA